MGAFIRVFFVTLDGIPAGGGIAKNGEDNSKIGGNLGVLLSTLDGIPRGTVKNGEDT